MHDERWLRAALGSFTADELATLDEVDVGTIPRAIWGLIGLAIMVLGAVVWLSIHDARIRKTAELQTVVDAKDDTIAQLNADIKQLDISIKAADSAYLAQKGTIVRVATVPQKLKDSLAALNATLAAYEARGDSVVPIAIAGQLDDQLKACRVQVDTIAGAVNALMSDCAQRVALRDSVIKSQQDIVRQMTDKLEATAKLAGLARPRFVPFAAADFSLARHKWDTELGARLRLFAGLNLRGSVGYRDSLDARIGAEYQFR